MSVLSVVIPAYNEEDGIAQIIERTLSVKPRLNTVGVHDLELIVVDDGSHDRTADIASQYPDVRLFKHVVNQGYGAALKTGFSQARGDLLGFLDADGTYPPEHFPELAEMALNKEIDLVIGSRMAGAESEMPFVRRLGNFVFANLINVLCRCKISDSSSGMRVIRRDALSRLYPLPDGLNFTPVMSTRALHEHISMQEIAIPYKERVGRSKLSVVHDGMRFLSTIVWTALNYNPVRLMGLLGLGLWVVAAVIGVTIVVMRVMGVNQLGPWGIGSVFLAGLSAVSGIALFSLGATFNYLVSLFHREPIRQGLFGRPLFKKPLERHFGWMGLAAMGLGLVAGVTSLILSLNGWTVERLWFYMVAAGMLIIAGLQFFVFWIIMRVLEELRQRDIHVAEDLEGKACEL